MISNDFLAVMILMAYYILGLFVLPAMLKVWSKLPGEIIRKMQHVCYSLSIFILLRLFSTWYMAVAAAFLLVLLAYPILFLIENTSLYQRLLVERTGCKGELRRQLIYVQLSFAILIFIFWGLFGVKWRYLIVVAAMVWGFGDAAAALIGKFFGKKSIVHRWVEGVKTYEGTAAMIVTAFFAIFVTLLVYGGLPWYICFLVALAVAPICGLIELFSNRGTDTITVPLATAVVVFPLVYLFSYLGW